MSFDEIRLPENIAYGFTGGPMYSTDVVTLFSGSEQRNQNWSLPRMKYVISHDVKDAGRTATLLAFFRNRKGKANGFRFRDWTDYSVTGQSIGTGDATTLSFQLVKNYTSSETETRIINKPVQGAHYVSIPLAVYLNGVKKTEGVDFTVNYTTGLVTFTVAPGMGVAITADFEFDVPVRFDTDAMQVRYEYAGEFYWENITLIEVRV